MLTQQKCPAPEVNTRMRRLARAVCFIVAQVALVMVSGSVAFADVPAETDFGASPAQAVVLAEHPNPSHALFVTRYANGQQQVMVRPVRGDAVVSFAGEHPSWRLDVGMTWFIQMPVYVRTLPITEEHPGRDSV